MNNTRTDCDGLPLPPVTTYRGNNKPDRCSFFSFVQKKKKFRQEKEELKSAVVALRETRVVRARNGKTRKERGFLVKVCLSRSRAASEAKVETERSKEKEARRQTGKASIGSNKIAWVGF
mmetsp:Transcript_5913/g.11735  ORF Transcript_5913/g.11735 Transcript_5913/m.11735 type:complete len:120 (-) Transcript_5913:1020-1379(-)